MAQAPLLKSSQSSRLQALRKRHTALSEQVEQAQRKPWRASNTDIAAMKKQKLMLKEQIEEIRGTAR